MAKKSNDSLSNFDFLDDIEKEFTQEKPKTTNTEVETG